MGEDTMREGLEHSPALEAFLQRIREAGTTDLLDDFVDDIRRVVADAIARGDLRTVSAVLDALHAPDRVDVFEELGIEDQRRIIEGIADADAADIMEELSDADAAEIAEGLTVKQLAAILDEMESDEAADVLLDLEPDRADELLLAMDDAAEAEVRTLLDYPDETAGGRMTRDFVALRVDRTVDESIEHLRRLSSNSETTYYLYVQDDDDRLVGIVSLRQLIISGGGTLVGDLMSEDVILVEAGADQETAARLMARYDLLALPVVDAERKLIGVITHDDLVDVLEEEATEDMYRLVGLDQAERPIDPVGIGVRKRLPWLTLNLVMQLALVGALVGFRSTIDKVAALAILFPLVTGQGGNVGAQTMTIVVRMLALGEIDRATMRRLLGKEVGVGLINGVAIGLMAGAIALFVARTPPETAGAIAAAMVAAMALNLTAGAVIGVVVPLLLDRFGFDPAVASSVFVTTLTDTLGVLFFIGLYMVFQAASLA